MINFIDCDEPHVPDGDDTPLTWAKTVIVKDGQFLLMHNCNRMQWESPGGGIEPGETLDQTALREVLEETCQHATQLTCRGIFKLMLKNHQRCEYGALYTGTVDDLQPFIVNNESDRITLWTYGDELDDRLEVAVERLPCVRRKRPVRRVV